MNKKDYLILGIVFGTIVFLWGIWLLTDKKAQNEVYIIVDNTEVFSCNLYDNKYVVLIKGQVNVYDDADTANNVFSDNAEATNLIYVTGGKVDVVEARCPDKICVNSICIDAGGESIVCMPNRAAVSIR